MNCKISSALEAKKRKNDLSLAVFIGDVIDKMPTKKHLFNSSEELLKDVSLQNARIFSAIVADWPSTTVVRDFGFLRPVKVRFIASLSAFSSSGRRLRLKQIPDFEF